MSQPNTEPTSQDYILDLHAQGMPYTEIARRLNRSARMVTLVATGQKPGTNLRPALTELSNTGQVTNEPERRTTATGKRVKVRGRAGAPSVMPPAPRRQPTRPPPAKKAATKRAPAKKAAGRRPSRPVDQPHFTARELTGRNTFNHIQEVNETTGREFHRIQGTKGRWSWGRWEANETIADITKRAATGLRRMQATVWVEVGKGTNRRRRPVQLGGHGGYDAQNVDLAIRVEGGDTFGWLESQVADRYPEFETENWTVVSVDIDVW